MQEKPSILIVDDDPDILDGILMILESQDYHLRTINPGHAHAPHGRMGSYP